MKDSKQVDIKQVFVYFYVYFVPLCSLRSSSIIDKDIHLKVLSSNVRAKHIKSMYMYSLFQSVE